MSRETFEIQILPRDLLHSLKHFNAQHHLSDFFFYTFGHVKSSFRLTKSFNSFGSMFTLFKTDKAKSLRLINFTWDYWAERFKNLAKVIRGEVCDWEVLNKNVVELVFALLTTLTCRFENTNLNPVLWDFFAIHLKLKKTKAYNLTALLCRLFGCELDETKSSTRVVVFDWDTSAYYRSEGLEVLVQIFVGPVAWQILDKHVRSSLAIPKQVFVIR